MRLALGTRVASVATGWCQVVTVRAQKACFFRGALARGGRVFALPRLSRIWVDRCDREKNFQKICEISDRREMALFNGRHQATAGFKRRHGLGRIDAGDGDPANAGHSFSTASAFPQQLARSGAFPRRLILPWFLSVGISVAQAVQCRRWVHRLAQNSYRISTSHSRAVLSSEVVTTLWTELR